MDQIERTIKPGDIFKHFKRELQKGDNANYLYEILNFAHHSETDEMLVVYRALYAPYKICARPYNMFMSEVDHEKYPEIKQKYRFEKLIEGEEIIQWKEEKQYLVKAYEAQNLTVKKGQIVFTGSSLMENFPVDKWVAEIKDAPICYNRGIVGYTTEDFLKVLDIAIFDLEPSKIYINIGTNDLANPDLPLEKIMDNYQEILTQIKNRLPQTEVVLLAYYPGNFDAAEDYMKDVLSVRTNEKIAAANKMVESLAEKNGFRFLNINTPLQDFEKTYNFYGWQTADVSPVDEKYKSIKNPRELYDLLLKIWCADTCAPRMRNNWMTSHPTYGQCSITAFLAQDIFGGEVYGILREGGNYHCYNVIGDCVFDLTSEQFGDEKLSYENNPVQSRDVHFAKEEKKLRYEYLKTKLDELLAIE